tara:strand:- start:214 stop:1041 length:828 start_codon:yes stop_codon:yes gene_type:complete
MNELILSSDTISEGRVKINDAYSNDTHIWATGSTKTNIIANNSTGNEAESEYNSVIGGESNKTLEAGGASNNSIIVGGRNHVISGNSTSFNSVIVGGQNNRTLVGNNECVALGGAGIMGDSDFHNEGSKTLFVDALATKGARFKSSRRIVSTSSTLGHSINVNDEVISYKNGQTFAFATVPSLDVTTLITGPISGRTVDFIWVEPNSSATNLQKLNLTSLFTQFSINGDAATGGGMGGPYEYQIEYDDYPNLIRFIHAGEDSSGMKNIIAYGVYT